MIMTKSGVKVTKMKYVEGKAEMLSVQIKEKKMEKHKK